MGSAGPQREGGLRRRASVETSCDTAPPHFPPKAGLSTACPPCRVVLAPWVWRPRPCPAASKGSLSVGIRCCPGRSRVLLWRLRPVCVPQGLGRAWGVFPELLPCPFPGSGNAPKSGALAFLSCLPQCLSGSGFSSQRKAASSEFEECQVARPWYFHQVSTALAFPQRSLRKHVPHP